MTPISACRRWPEGTLMAKLVSAWEEKNTKREKKEYLFGFITIVFIGVTCLGGQGRACVVLMSDGRTTWQTNLVPCGWTEVFRTGAPGPHCSSQMDRCDPTPQIDHYASGRSGPTKALLSPRMTGWSTLGDLNYGLYSGPLQWGVDIVIEWEMESLRWKTRKHMVEFGNCVKL